MNALLITALNFLVPCAHVCLLSGKCWACSVTVKGGAIFSCVHIAGQQKCRTIHTSMAQAILA